MEYTKGEWHVGQFPPLSNYRIYVQGVGTIPLLHREPVAMIEAQDNDEESLANANLIAAAPRMAEELKWLAYFISKADNPQALWEYLLREVSDKIDPILASIEGK